MSYNLMAKQIKDSLANKQTNKLDQTFNTDIIE